MKRIAWCLALCTMMLASCQWMRTAGQPGESGGSGARAMSARNCRANPANPCVVRITLPCPQCELKIDPEVLVVRGRAPNRIVFDLGPDLTFAGSGIAIDRDPDEPTVMPLARESGSSKTQTWTNSHANGAGASGTYKYTVNVVGTNGTPHSADPFVVND